MKSKIFNAIQKGLTNVLIFDDNDSSISYQKSNINNETNILKVSLDELYEIFKKSPDNIFKDCNTKDCLSLILNNGKEISLHKYNNLNVPVFLKISNNILKKSGNDIIIACNNNHYISENKLYWQNRFNQIVPDNLLIANEQDAFNDFNGYKRCQIIINNVENIPDLGNIPAINYCNDIKSPLLFYKGYLPSIGQLNFILKYLDMINYIFEYTGFSILNLSSDFWWSSSEDSSRFAWYLDNGNIYSGYKAGNGFTVLPLFALKK